MSVAAAVTVRPPTGDDAEAVVALVRACDVADLGAPDYDLGALLGEWAEPGVDLARDAWLLRDAAGRLVAYGLLLGGDGRAWVHPEHRGRGYGSRLASLVEVRAREAGRPSLSQQIPAGAGGAPARSLLKGRGYRLTMAYAHLTMAAHRAAALEAPAGIRPYDPARDEAAVQAVVERAFAVNGVRADSLQAVLARRPDTTLWFVTDDGRTGAVRAELRDGALGWISEVAVDPAATGRGTGTALLHAAARCLAARGATAVGLSVRSSNTGALRLYRRVGFEGTWDVQELTLDLR